MRKFSLAIEYASRGYIRGVSKQKNSSRSKTKRNRETRLTIHCVVGMDKFVHVVHKKSRTIRKLANQPSQLCNVQIPRYENYNPIYSIVLQTDVPLVNTFRDAPKLFGRPLPFVSFVKKFKGSRFSKSHFSLIDTGNN